MTHWSDDLPPSVRVGYRIYLIEVSGATALHGTFGVHSSRECTIALGRHQAAAEAAQTLLHELLHAVTAVFGDPEWKEEPVVTLYSAGLATIMQANPRIFAWIARNLAVTA